MSTQPQTTNATHPFNKTSADAILRSADNVDFWVRRSILAEASCVFEDMLNLPQPPPGSLDDDEIKDGLPVIRVAELSAALDKLLRLCYPTNDPEFYTLDELRPVLEAALKYMMQEAVSLLRKRLVKLGQAQPLRAFATACSLDLPSEADTLAPLAHSVHGSFVQELDEISAGVYYRLAHYSSPPPSGCSPHKPRQRRRSLTTSPILPSQPRCMPTLLESHREPIPPELQSSPSADIVLQASDGVEYHLHSAILALASPVLAKIVQDHTQASQTITLPEDSHVLTTLFQYIYPLARPDPPTSFSTLKAVLLAAHRYTLSSVLSALRSSLLSFLPSPTSDTHPTEDKDALRVFALAQRLNLPAERTAAARALLRLSRPELHARYTDELEHISAAVYFRLLEYHDRCTHAAAALVLSHALAYSNIAPPSPPHSPPSSPSSSLSSYPPPSPASLTARRKHSAACHVVLDGTSDLAWARFRTQSTPRWWIMYVYKLGVVLKYRPWSHVVLDAGLRQRAMARAAECEHCRTYFLHSFVDYTDGLRRDVDKAIMKVKLDL